MLFVSIGGAFTPEKKKGLKDQENALFLQEWTPSDESLHLDKVLLFDEQGVACAAVVVEDWTCALVAV